MGNKDEWLPVLFCPEFRCSEENQLTTTLSENKSAKTHIQQQKHTNSGPVLVKLQCQCNEAEKKK